MINDTGTMTGGGGRPRGGRMCLGSAAPRPADTRAAAAELAAAEKQEAASLQASACHAGLNLRLSQTVLCICTTLKEALARSMALVCRGKYACDENPRQWPCQNRRWRRRGSAQTRRAPQRQLRRRRWRRWRWASPRRAWRRRRSAPRPPTWPRASASCRPQRRCRPAPFCHL